MHVGRLESLCLQLAHSSILICDSVHFLLLNGRWGNIHAKNDVFDLALSQTRDINVVFLCIVGKNEVL